MRALKLEWCVITASVFDTVFQISFMIHFRDTFSPTYNPGWSVNHSAPPYFMLFFWYYYLKYGKNAFSTEITKLEGAAAEAVLAILPMMGETPSLSWSSGKVSWREGLDNIEIISAASNWKNFNCIDCVCELSKCSKIINKSEISKIYEHTVRFSVNDKLDLEEILKSWAFIRLMCLKTFTDFFLS